MLHNAEMTARVRKNANNALRAMARDTWFRHNNTTLLCHISPLAGLVAAYDDNALQIIRTIGPYTVISRFIETGPVHGVRALRQAMDTIIDAHKTQKCKGD